MASSSQPRQRPSQTAGELSIHQAARQAGVSRSQVRYWIHREQLAARRLARGQYRIPAAEFAAYLSNRAEQLTLSAGYLSPQQAVAESGLSISTIQDLIHTGKLPAERGLGRRWKIRRRDFTAVLKQRQSAERGPPAGHIPIDQVCREFAVTRKRLWALIDSGKIGGLRHPVFHQRFWCVRRKSIEAYFEQRREAVTPPAGYLAIAAASRRYGIRIVTLEDWRRRKKMASLKRGQFRFIEIVSLEAYMEARRKPQSPLPPKLVTPKQAAARYGISKDVFCARIASGEIKAIRRNGRLGMHPQSLQAFMRRRKDLANRPAGTMTQLEAHLEFGIGQSTLDYLIVRKRIPSRQWGRWRMVRRADLQAYFKHHGDPRGQIPPGYWTPSQAAKRYGLSKGVILEAIAKKQITAVHIRGRFWGIEPRSLKNFAKSYQQTHAALPKGYITRRQAQEEFGLANGSLHFLIRTGRLATVKIGRQRGVLRADLVAREAAGRSRRSPLPAGCLSAGAAAKVAGVGVGQVTKWITTGILPAESLPGGRYLVREAALAAFLKDRKKQTALVARRLNLKDAARTSGLGVTTLLRAIAKGELSATRLPGGRWCIRQKDLTAYLRQRRKAMSRASTSRNVRQQVAGRFALPASYRGGLTMADAARQADVQESTVRQWVVLNGLPARKLMNGRISIEPADLQAFLQRRAQGPMRPRLPAGYLSATQAAKHAGVSRDVLMRWINQQQLPSSRLPSGWYCIATVDLDRFLQQPERAKGNGD